MRPVIGISAGLVQATWGVWDERAFLLSAAYIGSIQEAGGLALMLPPDAHLAKSPDEVLDLLDGLIISGGVDIGPENYGAEPHPMTAEPVPERDSFELALVKAAVERDMPLLGICRGMQVINVAYGGTLHQHLPETHGHEDHRRVPGSFDGADHDVTLTPGSVAARAAGEHVHATKSHHHQGVDRLGEGLTITGRSTLDELPEAIEDEDKTFVLGVQWHPEADPTSTVVAALVDEARDYRSRRGSAYPASRTAAVTR